MKIRIKFCKWGVMKFVGHLDMMRYFQKAMRRADIDICYSEGFSPHPVMSFAAPLGVGLTSDGEYLDIEVHSSPASREALSALNDVMVEGVKTVSYVRLPDNAKAAMSLVAAADYRLRIREGCDSRSTAEWEEMIRREFWDRKEFVITKKTKKSEREVDLKPLVYALSVREEEGKPAFYMTVSTGSTDNVKPELVLSSICGRCGISLPAEAVRIHRMEIYARENGGLIPLKDMGEELT
ncbi:MAG: TIGR03936 family radical SAM-associated protein [Muribaculaceae bacterium]|nr:TIGR03936 family radical SAM-associated protein [Roseburia sp.]MCM1430373.1 TIGR03936 family radical SAM-associated protein [Muribaculaceae bacterium]MCM1492431.1 TIGR03936 family radical SAM-associated protein [Muribaculaceae bacterium]